MYQLGKRKRSTRWLRRVAMAGLVIALVGISIFGCVKLLRLHAQPVSVIQNMAAHTTAFNSTPSKVSIDEPDFTMELPAGWKPYKFVTNVYPPTYSFRSNGEQIQLVNVYIDTIPSGLAVNRVLVVNAEDNGMSHEVVSDNCVNFTNPTADEKQKGIADGKWQGTNFWCDVGNYERDVVGITSSAGVNEIPLAGPKTGMHKVFLTYTDNAINPDYGIFYDILDSFKMK